MTLAEMKKQYIKASQYYYNVTNCGTTIKMTDAAFDKLEKAIRKLDPKWEQLAKTGVSVTDKKTEVALAYFMPSLLKFYPDKIEKQLAKQKGTRLMMDKLDGCSLQLIYDNGKPIKLITRGDGTLGGDISFLIPFLNIPKSIDYKQCVVFRCEGILTEAVFEKKYATTIDNARAAVNGWFNRKKPAAGLADVHIVVLGVYNMTMRNGLSFAKKCGLEPVRASINIDVTINDRLPERKASSIYAMDGLVICDEERTMSYANADKPKWIWAYKENESLEDAAKAKVVDIIYQDSRHSTLVPKIQIEPTRIGGTTVEFATCHNAQWMLDRGIGPGAIIQIVRSGDVIPKIVGVVKKASPKLPDVPYELVGVHFKAIKRSREADVNALRKFFTTLGVEFIAEKTIGKLYDKGVTTCFQYMAVWKSGNSTVLREWGISPTMSIKLYEELDRVFKNGVLLRDLMVASGKLEAGLGDRRIKAIELAVGYQGLVNLVKADPDDVLKILYKVPGFAEKTTIALTDSMVEFRSWLKEALKYIVVRKPITVAAPKLLSNKLNGLRVSFTDYRDSLQEKYITDNGGEIVDFGKKTQMLFYKAGGKSTKTSKAVAQGIPTCCDFNKWRK